MLINVYVFIFLMGESIAPCVWAGVGLVVSPVERVKKADLNRRMGPVTL